MEDLPEHTKPRREEGSAVPGTARRLGGLVRRHLSARLARGAGVVFALQVAGAGLGYGLHVLLARWMGEGGYGTYIYAMSWGALVAAFGGLGFPSAALRFVPAYSTDEDFGLLRGFLKESRRAVAAAAAAAALAGAALAFLFLPTPNLARAPVLIGLALAPLWALMLLETDVLRARQRVAWAYAPPKVMRPLLVLAGTAALLVLPPGLSPEAVLALAAAALALTLLVQHLAARRTFRQARRHAPERKRRLWTRTALPLLLMQGFLMIISKTDIFFIGALRDPEAVGVYAAAFRTAHAMTFAGAAVDAVAAPAVAARYAEGDRAALQRLTSRLAHAYFWPALLLAGGLAVASGFILNLFGPGFTAGRPAMLVLMAGLLVNAGTGAQTYLLSLTGHERLCARVYGWSALVNVGLNAVGVYFLGALGAALATTATVALWNLWQRALVVRHLGIRPSILHALNENL